jgi:hypothetical protein
MINLIMLTINNSLTIIIANNRIQALVKAIEVKIKETVT